MHGSRGLAAGGTAVSSSAISPKDLILRIDRVGVRLRTLDGRLAQLGYQFERPDLMLPGVEPGTEAAIARIEGDAGLFPLALRLFWLRVGSVDFCGHLPEWDGCEFPDPIVVYPPSVAVAELNEFLGDLEEATKFGGR